MKPRVVILITCVAILLFIAYQNVGISSVVSPSSPLPVPTGDEKHTPTTLTYMDIIYDYGYFVVSDLKKLTLLPNFDSPIRGSAIVSQQKCAYAVNGGFYSTESTPLGAFIGNGYTQPSALTSRLFNGFFAFTGTRGAITTDLDTSYTSVLQSGPLLYMNNSPLPLAIQNDEHARRSAVVTTTEGKILFVTFYIRDSIYNGPLLEDLPMIIKQFASNEGFSIDAALNLDGGSATYFKTPDTELPELSPIGSLFCLQK